MESTENTMSMRMIWKITAPKLVATREVLSRKSAGLGSTAPWISLVAFQSRKRPPAIRIRSRQEKVRSNAPAVAPREKTGSVRCTSQARVDSRASRMTKARVMPSLRAF